MAEYSTDEYLELMAEELKRIKLMADKGTGPPADEQEGRGSRHETAVSGHAGRRRDSLGPVQAGVRIRFRRGRGEAADD